ncbi:MAG: hypothetical protein ABS76_07025 [Pelagibacterium sp. SCN 64-44]|nr:MAG: hypothetical protein ABS76_07025 [Pelagibacterium sp. SCN 64-44]
MLSGRTILIVEAEFLISLSMQAVLQGLGASQFIVLTSPAQALQKRSEWGPIGLAILEIEANHPDQMDLARAMVAEGVPVLGLTADSRLGRGVPDLPDTPILVKPVPDEVLAETAQALLAGAKS